MTLQLIPQTYAAASTWTDPACTSEGVATIRGIECLFRNIITPFPAIIALLAVGMVILSGIRLLTAGPDPKAYASAWSTFTWAVIGLILLSAAWLIIILVERFTGANLSTFTIGL